MESNKNSHRHFLIFKPYGVLSQFKSNSSKQQSKTFLGEFYDFPDGTMAVGRLDEASEGLLLLTTDGKSSALVNSQKVEKEYYAQVDGTISEVAIEQLKMGVEISIEGNKYLTKPCEVHRLIETPDLPARAKKIRDERHGPTTWVSIILTEGKFRQVRKMTSAVGFPTLRLVRVRIGKFKIGNMKAGGVVEVNHLTEKL
ncbi:pseudouridine synthase [Flavisericum labens]|uniref:pseudouridine synthase n=1 Tax=Flavisericum labens TaxID=3377112 RepID=UPI00387B980F